MNSTIKFYNNGNSVVEISESAECPPKDFFDSGLIGVMANTRNFNINLGVGENLDCYQLLEKCLKQEITAINLFKKFSYFCFGDFETDDGEYEHVGGWVFKSSRKTYDLTNSPFKDQLKWFRKMARGSDLNEEEIYTIVSSLEYKDFICKGIDVHENCVPYVRFVDEKEVPSGVVFSTPDKGSKPNKEEFNSCFEQYKKYLEGDIAEYCVSFYDRDASGEWLNTDMTTLCEESVENVIECLELENVVDEPDPSLYDCIRKNIPNYILLEQLHQLSTSFQKRT